MNAPPPASQIIAAAMGGKQFWLNIKRNASLCCSSSSVYFNIFFFSHKVFSNKTQKKESQRHGMRDMFNSSDIINTRLNANVITESFVSLRRNQSILGDAKIETKIIFDVEWFRPQLLCYFNKTVLPQPSSATWRSEHEHERRRTIKINSHTTFRLPRRVDCVSLHCS